MFRTKLTLAVLALVAAFGAQTAVAQATPFTTDTLAPGGGTSTSVQGYRIITDTLAPGGGSSGIVSTPSASGFDWGDAGIGAAGGVGVVLVLLGGGVAVLRKRDHSVLTA